MMKYNIHTLLYIGMLPILAACSTHDDSEGTANYEGFPKEVNLSAATVTATTRSQAAGGNAEVWAGTERIAVHMKVDNPVENAGFTEATYPYTPSPTGELTAENEKFYFRSPNDPARTCDAWYWPLAKDANGNITGYSEQSPEGQVISVPADQSKTPHADNDWLYAPPTAILYNSKNPNMVYSLLFCHQLTWVSFQVVADNSSQYDTSDLSATMGTETEPLIYQAKFSAPSGQTTSTGSREVFGAYSSTGDEVKSGVITPYKLPTPDVDGVICRYEAVLIPQTLSADGTTTHNLFNMTLGGKTYRYVSTMGLKAGVHYTFNLKIAKGDNPLLFFANAKEWEMGSVLEMEKLHVIASLWESGPFTGTTADGDGWNDGENHGSSNTGNNWADKENHGSSNSGNDWGNKETTGTTNSGNAWGDKEPTDDRGTTGTANGWGANENNGSVSVDANSWKKGTNQNASVSAGQDWQKEGTTQYW